MGHELLGNLRVVDDAPNLVAYELAGSRVGFVIKQQVCVRGEHAEAAALPARLESVSALFGCGFER